MIKTDFNELKKYDVLSVAEFGQLIKGQGFQLAKRFSTEDHRVFVSQDGRFVIHVVRNAAKIYSTQDQKNLLHTIHLKVV